MRCNWRRWLWGLIPLVMLSWLAIQAERPGIEQELTDGAVKALTGSQAPWAKVAFEGRDAFLSGRAADEEEADKAYDLLAALRGVRIVENRANLIEGAETYLWSATRRNQRIRLSGYVPNTSTRQAILGVAKANFPGFEVNDRMTLMRGVPSADTWLGGVSFALKQLAFMKKGDVRLEGLGLTVTGEAEDQAAFRAIKAALDNPPRGIKVTLNQVTPPHISPYVWTARLANGQIEIGGYFPDDAARAKLLDAAKAAGRGEPVDRTQPGEGAPADWAAAAQAAIRVLGKLESGSAELKDATLAVSGIAADEPQAKAARASLKAEVPASIKLTQQITAHPPPPPEKGASKSETPEPQPQVPAPAVAPPEPVPPPKRAEPEPPGKGKSAEAQVPEKAPVPKAKAPEVKPPEAKAPDVKTPEAKAPEAKAPEAKAPAAKAPEPKTPEAKAPEATAPQTKTPEPKAPDAKEAKEAKVPQSVQIEVRTCQATFELLTHTAPILFQRGSARLTGVSTPTLAKMAEAMKSCPNVIVRIEGHTDVSGTTKANELLSLHRAEAVVAHLVKAGVDAAQLEAAGFGKRRPVAPNDTSANMAKNRRIEFLVRSK